MLLDQGCQGPLNQTVNRTANTTISCGKKGFTPDSRVKLFCKENGPICEDILSTKSALRSNGMFTLTETESGFNVSISNVSPQHAGVYWCGVESTEGSYRAALRKIQLEMEDGPEIVIPVIICVAALMLLLFVIILILIYKQTSLVKLLSTLESTGVEWNQLKEVTELLSGKYNWRLKGAPGKKFICKGEDPSICEHVVSTAQNTERFSMIDETEKRNITITVRGVTKEDSGTYWCGAEIKTETQSNSFFNRFLMTVVQPPTPTFPVITVIICVAALLLLLFVLILILIYTRKRFETFKKCLTRYITTSASCTQDEEKEITDYIYEEIQERPQKPDSGNTINTIYSTANFPTNPSASLRYSTINFRNGSGEAAEVLMTNPSSSACDYSAVKDGETSTCSNVNQPSPVDPLYSTVNKTQQQ
ncbi:hypothetical protein NQZ68_024534 [Dissostichus eleginoides]|nr:hypothetical protein NQZ68_024534 [Dissostichus eleginoides]